MMLVLVTNFTFKRRRICNGTFISKFISEIHYNLLNWNQLQNKTDSQPKLYCLHYVLAPFCNQFNYNMDVTKCITFLY